MILFFFKSNIAGYLRVEFLIVGYLDSEKASVVVGQTAKKNEAFELSVLAMDSAFLLECKYDGDSGRSPVDWALVELIEEAREE